MPPAMTKNCTGAEKAGRRRPTPPHPAARRSGVAGWLYERFFIQALNSGASTIRCITSPGNATSIAFHTGMGFDLEPGDTVRDGLPIHLDYDGPGLDRVSFARDLSPAQ